ncbi:hypothetical protein ACWDBO_44900 [Streptomyces mirabilis]|uniref:hypothetical protein n=1 Tax=Streptomyces mirabilis TaxID=68239 RepID=UPI00331EB18E
MGSNDFSSGQARERLEPITTHAVNTVTELMHGAGPGRHLITAAVRTPGSEPVIAYTWFDISGEDPDVYWYCDIDEVLKVAKAIALAFILSAGSVVLGTSSITGAETVRAWTVDGRELKPLTADEVSQAFGAVLGIQPSAESDITYQTAYPLPSSAVA